MRSNLDNHPFGADAMLLLIAGLVIFLGIHSLSIVNEPLRDRLAARLGTVGWPAVYALIAIVGFVLILQGYAAARLAPVLRYPPPVWLRDRRPSRSRPLKPPPMVRPLQPHPPPARPSSAGSSSR